VRSWSSWFVLVGALVAGSAGAAVPREIDPAAATTSSLRADHTTRPELLARSVAQSVEKSTWFDIDEQSGRGWYSKAQRDQPLPRWIEHDSLPRDTIENVAIRYGVSPAWLRRWNGMSPRARLDPNHPEPLRVRAKRLPPPREHLIHVAVQGDTWDSVARRHGVFDRHLQAWNKHELGRTLEPGERVSVWVEPMVRETMRAEPLAPGRAALIPPGANGIGTPQSGRLAAGVQIPPGEGYERRYPNQAWGTTYAVRHLVLTLDEFHQNSGYTGTLMLGSMSFRRGGKFGPHVSHQSGRDIDIRLPAAGRKND
jgi:LysM repeat protein